METLMSIQMLRQEDGTWTISHDYEDLPLCLMRRSFSKKLELFSELAPYLDTIPESMEVGNG